MPSPEPPSLVPMDDGSCDFCGIVSGRLPRIVRYEDDDILVFKNALKWVPVMFLITPKAHLTQAEFWTSPLLPHAAKIATELGEADSPEGFRLVSNFGIDAMQSQHHGHLHVVGGTHLGLYVDFPGKSDFWIRVYGQPHHDPEALRGLTE